MTQTITQTAAEIAKRLEGEVLGDATTLLTGFAAAGQAKPGDLTFAENEQYFAAAEDSAATAIIAGPDAVSTKKVLIRVKNPRVAFARALEIFFSESRPAAGIHPSAVIAGTAQVDPTAHIGPNCVIAERVKIGARAILVSGVYIGDDSTVGEDSRIFSSVTVYARTQIGKRVRIHANSIVGSDGFGYVFDAGVHRKVLQVGTTNVGDDVEIGAGVTIDRGALGATSIGKGTKIDNQVHIAHNVEVGEHCLLCGQVGIAGSAKLGSYVVLAGQVGIAGHLKIGNRVTVGSRAGVMNNIPDGETWLGTPAQPHNQAKRLVIAVQRLPDVLKKVAAWEKKLNGE